MMLIPGFDQNTPWNDIPILPPAIDNVDERK